jgi:hypothetical protein
MESMGAAKAAVFLELKLSRGVFLVFGCCIVAVLTFRTSKCNDVSHDKFLL